MAVECGATGRRGSARAIHALVGVEFSLSAALSVRQPADDHGPGARHRLPRHRHASGQKRGYKKKMARTGAVVVMM